MTAALDLHPDAGHPALVGAWEVHAVLDRLAGDPSALAGFDDGECAAAVAECDRVAARVAAVQLTLLARAEQDGVGRAAGFTDTAAWAARKTRSEAARTARQVRLANDLDTGFTPTGEALSDGVVSPAHAAVIVDAVNKLPREVDDVGRGRVEAHLLDQAQRCDPARLRRKARRALEILDLPTTEGSPDPVDVHEDTLLRAEEDAARAATRLTLHDNDDGTVSGHFTVPAVAGSLLRKVLDTMTSPRRGRLGASDAQAGPAPLRRDPAHERGLAFVELLEHLPVDHLHGRTAVTLVATISEDVLHGALKAARLDTGETISAGEARRLACSAGILPAVLRGKSTVLDLGRQERLFTEPQRTALGLRHTTCAADGCERPYAWCELHHRVPWSAGGRTDLDDAVPLCGWHHRRIHDPSYLHHTLPDGTIRFRRRR